MTKSMVDIMKEITDFKSSAMSLGANIFAITIADCVNALIVDMEDGTILFSTPGVNSLFGYMKDELDGKNITDLMPQRFRSVHGAHLAKFSDSPTIRSMGEREMKIFGQKRDGGEFPIRIGLHPKVVAGKRCAVATILDVSELATKNSHGL